MSMSSNVSTGMEQARRNGNVRVWTSHNDDDDDDVIWQSRTLYTVGITVFRGNFVNSVKHFVKFLGSTR